ncbi:type II toxin-antitoxin system MqsA family antitoxin [Candidatus Sumerlaeota bacterium]|nr:type II toxin-antitoxin system MqsA family antitoxin [Candidatus Sumerlaeota bacterium]
MNANPGHCPLCGGEKQSGTTTFAVDLTFGVVVVRGVPALVCAQCGDAWIEDPVAEKLERFVAEAHEKHPTVEVTHWEQVAA